MPLGYWGVSDWTRDLLELLSTSLFSRPGESSLAILELFLKGSIAKSIWVSARDDSFPFEEDCPLVSFESDLLDSNGGLLRRLVALVQRRVARASNQ